MGISLAGKIHCGQYYQRIGKAAAGEGCIQRVVGASQNSAVHIPGQPAGTGPAAAHTKGIPASEKYRAAHCKEGCPAPEPEQEFDAVQDPQDRGAQHAVYGAKRLLDAAREEEYPDEDVQAALRTLLTAAERGDAYAQYQAGKLYREGYFLPRDDAGAKMFLKGPQSMKIILRNTRSESCTRMRCRRSSTKRKPRTGLNGLRSMGTDLPNTGLRNVF